jgi:4-amino-4-deoxy-L-arabinose transferase-like glycosyltransferase
MPRLWWPAVFVLLAILGVELLVPARDQSQTPDEANHMLAGVRYWKYQDFGTNPEHPPLVKLVAALPILRVPTKLPAPTAVFFKAENFISAISFLYEHDADSMLLRARLAASVFTLMLALLVLAAGCEMFGRAAGLVALLLFVFEPTVLAHGALVTTDMAVACFYFAAIYAFYRWAKAPSATRLLLCGLAAGLALAAKHSGVFIAPVLLLLAIGELFRGGPGRGRRAFRLGTTLALIGLIAYVTLWGFYGFRYQARPGNLAMVPTLASYCADAHSGWMSVVIPRLASWHLFPEAYLYGIVDIVISEARDPMVLLGKVYATGHWFYFPVTFVIKSTLGLLLLLIVAPFLRTLRQPSRRREMVFLLIPPLAWFAVSMTSTMNLGVRHVLPAYPFFAILAAASAMALASKRRWGAVAATVLVLCHVASSAHAFPNYLPYANEAWGGPSKTYRLLSDSNADWGQGLKAARAYLDQHQITDCWFAHYGWNVDPAYYRIPCRLLPQGLQRRFAQPLPPVPGTIEGTVLISGSEADGDYWGPGALNPYRQFLERHPDDIIANSILVFRGKFEVPLLSAISHMSRAEQLASQRHLDEALAEARTAADLAPNSAEAQAVLGNILLQMKQTSDARLAFRNALAIAHSTAPDFQTKRILHIPPDFLPK